MLRPAPNTRTGAQNLEAKGKMVDLARHQQSHNNTLHF
jgi:hypothetical protein